MAVSYISKGSYVANTVAFSITPPSGIVSGDLLLLVIESVNNMPADPAGWTFLQAGGHSSYNANMRVYYKFTTGTESNLTITPISGSGARAIMTAWRGVNPNNPFDGISGSEASGSTASFTNPTTAFAADMLVNLVGFYQGTTNDTSNFSSWANTSLASISEGHDQHDSVSGGITFAFGLKNTSGSTANTTAATDSGSTQAYCISVALRQIIPEKDVEYPVEFPFNFTVEAGTTAMDIILTGSNNGGEVRGRLSVAPGDVIGFAIAPGGAGSTGNFGGGAPGGSGVRVTKNGSIVAAVGGGGGNGGDGSLGDGGDPGGAGGVGGGLNAGNGVSMPGAGSGGAGGTQLTGITSGIGANGVNGTSDGGGSNGGGGGGGGYRGGSAGNQSSGWDTGGGGGGGGSSYVGGLASFTLNRQGGSYATTAKMTLRAAKPSASFLAFF